MLFVLTGCALATGCERDPCATDTYESNETFEEGYDLGTLTDQESQLHLPLTLDTADDTDVFFFNVLDEGSDGNPEVDIWVEGQDNDVLELTLEYQCTTDQMVEFQCTGQEVPGLHGGRACRLIGGGSLHINLNYDCAGGIIDSVDSGFAIVTVSRTSPPVECAAYDLDIETD